MSYPAFGTGTIAIAPPVTSEFVDSFGPMPTIELLYLAPSTAIKLNPDAPEFHRKAACHGTGASFNRLRGTTFA
jgi:hypothetical protein